LRTLNFLRFVLELRTDRDEESFTQNALPSLDINESADFYWNIIDYASLKKLSPATRWEVDDSGLGRMRSLDCEKQK